MLGRADGEVINRFVRVGYLSVCEVGALSMVGSRKNMLLVFLGAVTAPLLLASFACHPASQSSSKQPAALRSSDQAVLFVDQHVDNCGLNVAYLTLGYFDRRVPIDELALRLGVGEYHEKLVSMDVLHQGLAGYGLTVEGLKFEDLGDMLGLLNPRNVSLAYAVGGSEAVAGHFVFLTARSNGEIIIADPPAAPEILSGEDAIHAAALANCSGQFLLVSVSPP